MCETRPDAPLGSYEFGKVNFSLVKLDQLPDLFDRWSSSGRQTMTVTLTGAHGIAESRRSDAVRRAHESADVVLCDGFPARVGARIEGRVDELDRIPGRVAFHRLALEAAMRDLPQHFVGGPPGLAEMARKGVCSSIARPIDGGDFSPPFSSSVDDEYVRTVSDWLDRQEGPSVVWLGLSTPKQEILAQHLKRLRPSGFFIVCVGAAFDMFAGTKTPAPEWISKYGIEWLYRSFQEPTRLPRRYLGAAPALFAATAQAAGRRFRRTRQRTATVCESS